MATMTPATTPETTKRKPTLRRGSKPYLFHVESKSRPGVFHVADAYRMTCTCEAGRARRLCWHVRLAVRSYDWWQHMHATAQAEQDQTAAPSAATGMRALQQAFE